MTETTSHHQSLTDIDEQPINRFHFKMIITAGMGFFTDAYDLFVIGIVTTLLMPLWQLTPHNVAWLNAASLASAALGAVLFGWLADRFGRKRIYGIELMILIIGACLSAVAPTFIMLLLARILVGMGIGGDYPTSAVFASECANRQNRGALVLMVFAMQALGMIVGPLIAAGLLMADMPHTWTWRILLALGALPALSVLYLRRRIQETPRYLRAQQAPVEASRLVSELSGYEDAVSHQPVSATHKLYHKPWLKYLIGTAGAWFLLDVAFYGNSISSMLIMKSISPDASLMVHMLSTMLMFLGFAVPGYAFAACFVDRIGRKRLQILGFGMMALSYLLIATFPSIKEHLGWFLPIFGLSFFFINFGPNSTTFLIPSEIYPTSIRAQAHGLSAAIGKCGAFIGTFFLPIVLHHLGLSVTMTIIGSACLLGVAVTFLIPEMKGRSLDEAEKS